MAFQLVIFDLGGVLVRRRPHEILERVARETGRSAEECRRILSDPALIEPFELGQTGPKQFFEALRGRLGLPWSFEQFVQAWNSILSENTDVIWVLERLRSRYRLAVISNTNVLHDEYIRGTWPVFAHIHSKLPFAQGSGLWAQGHASLLPPAQSPQPTATWVLK